MLCSSNCWLNKNHKSFYGLSKIQEKSTLMLRCSTGGTIFWLLSAAVNPNYLLCNAHYEEIGFMQ